MNRRKSCRWWRGGHDWSEWGEVTYLTVIRWPKPMRAYRLYQERRCLKCKRKETEPL